MYCEKKSILGGMPKILGVCWDCIQVPAGNNLRSERSISELANPGNRCSYIKKRCTLTRRPWRVTILYKMKPCYFSDNFDFAPSWKLDSRLMRLDRFLSQILFEIRFESLFNQLFRSKYLKSDQMVVTKLIKSCLIYIEKVNLYQK